MVHVDCILSFLLNVNQIFSLQTDSDWQGGHATHRPDSAHRKASSASSLPHQAPWPGLPPEWSMPPPPAPPQFAFPGMPAYPGYGIPPGLGASPVSIFHCLIKLPGQVFHQSGPCLLHLHHLSLPSLVCQHILVMAYLQVWVLHQ